MQQTAVRVIAVVIFPAMLAAPALARQADRIATLTSPVTSLGKALAGTGTHGDTAFWKKAQVVIRSSDPEKDARADAASGHAGLMTHANDSIIERHTTPGLRCLDRSEPRRRSVFHFGYKTPLPAHAGKALLAFDVYAQAYNRAVLRGRWLGETSCRLAGE